MIIEDRMTFDIDVGLGRVDIFALRFGIHTAGRKADRIAERVVDRKRNPAGEHIVQTALVQPNDIRRHHVLLVVAFSLQKPQQLIARTVPADLKLFDRCLVDPAVGQILAHLRSRLRSQLIMRVADRFRQHLI